MNDWITLLFIVPLALVLHFGVILPEEKYLALQNLAKAAQLPGFLSYGRLKILPWYDPLRGDPRFEKIVDSLAPK